MTPAQFRRIALALPGAGESAHMGTADFRVGNRIFATLGNPDAAWGVVGLTADQQRLLTATAPDAFIAVPGEWGARGWTRVRLGAVDAASLTDALTLAWQNRAPKSSLRQADASGTPPPRSTRPMLARAFARVRKAAKATRLPGIAEGTSYGTPALKVAGKFLMRVEDAETFVFRCTTEEKAFLTEAEPGLYFETAHYAGSPVVLVRAAAASDAELAHCIARAWRAQAPKKLLAGHARPASQKSTDKKKRSAAQ